MANTFTITRDTETKTFTIERGVGRDGSDASVTLANVRAAVPNMVEVASPANDDMIQRVGGSWVTRTIAQVRTALGLGTAAYTASTDYATAAQGSKADRAALVDIVNTFEQQIGFQQGIDDGTGSGGQNFIPSQAGTLINNNSTQIGSVKSSSFTAATNGIYTVTATATVTDPITPVEGQGFTVIVRNGTATVGGTAYATAGTIIRRIYHSGSYTNYVYKNLAQLPADLAATITAANSKATPVDADELPLADSAASFGLKKLTFANLWAWVQSKFAGASSKTTPIDADSFNIVDSADSNAAKRVTGTNLKAYLKTYLDTLYGLLGGNNTWSGTNAFSSTTRPTSSGTGTPASNSLMMLKDVEDNSLGQRIIVMPLNVVFPNTVVNSATVTTFPPSVLRLLTSNTTGSSALASANTLLGIRLNREIGLPSSYIQWSDRFRVSLSFSYFNPDANTIFRFQIGEDVFKTTVSDLDQKGIGLKLENNSLKVQTHNGSSLTVSSSIATLAAGSFYDILMDSDGSGNLLVYINDTLTTTITSTGVTGYSSLNGVAVNASVTNGAGTEFLDVRLNNSIKIKIL